MESIANILGREALNPTLTPTLSPLPFHLSTSLPKYRRINTNSNPIHVRTDEFVPSRKDISPRKVITIPLFTPWKEMCAINQSIHERGICKRKIDMRGDTISEDLNNILSPAKRPPAPYPMKRDNITKLLKSQIVNGASSDGSSDGEMEQT